MRRILRKIAMEETETLGDVSTLDDPTVVKEIIEAHVQYKSQLSQKKWMNGQREWNYLCTIFAILVILAE